MNIARPRLKRLRYWIVCFLGAEKKCAEQQLKERLGKVYKNIPSDQLESALAALLSQLEKSGILHIGTDNQIALTEAGRAEYVSIALALEARRQKEAKTARLKQTKRTKQQRKALARSAREAKRIHEELKVQLIQLAHALGKNAKPEHKLGEDVPVKLDLVWYRKLSEGITHAFEVQHRGDWKNALGNLETVGRHFSNCRLFLVVFDEEEMKPIKGLLGTKRNTSIKVLSASQVKGWLANLEKVPEGIGLEERRRLFNTIESMVLVGLSP